MIAIFGKPLFKPTICIASTLVVLIVLSLFLFSVFFDKDTPDYWGWIVFSITLVIGAIVGLILARFSRFGVAVLAAFGGFIVGIIIYGTCLYKLDNDKQLFYWCFNIALALIFGLLTIWLYRHMLIISTAFVGSYLFIRGISLYAGHFPSEADLINEIKYSEFRTHIDPIFYVYMVSWVIASIISMIIQYKYWITHDHHKHPYHYKR